MSENENIKQKEQVSWLIDQQILREFKKTCIDSGENYSETIEDLMEIHVKKHSKVKA